MRTPRQCALATTRPGNCSLTCSARPPTPCFRRSRRVWLRLTAVEQCGRFYWNISRRFGGSPTKASGRCVGGPQNFVHSKVMAWVAFDRAANEVAAGEFQESGQRWREIADEIHAEVCARGFNHDLNSFVQAYGSKRLDASLL